MRGSSGQNNPSWVFVSLPPLVIYISNICHLPSIPKSTSLTTRRTNGASLFSLSRKWSSIHCEIYQTSVSSMSSNLWLVVTLPCGGGAGPYLATCQLCGNFWEKVVASKSTKFVQQVAPPLAFCSVLHNYLLPLILLLSLKLSGRQLKSHSPLVAILVAPSFTKMRALLYLWVYTAGPKVL